MAAIAGRVLAVLGETFTDGGRGGAGFGFEGSVDTGRGRRDAEAEDVVEEPFAAEDGGCAIGVRSCSEHCAVGEQAAAPGGVGEFHPAETAAVDAGDVVV